jgi:hypothetical protein
MITPLMERKINTSPYTIYKPKPNDIDNLMQQISSKNDVVPLVIYQATTSTKKY